MNLITVIGHFGKNRNFLDGQTVKTKIITEELKNKFGGNNVFTVDTFGGKKKLLLYPFIIFSALKKSKNVIILPAHRGLRVIAPLIKFENIFFKRKIHYVVIGGWLPEYLKSHKFVFGAVKSFDGIYVETGIMKSKLNGEGLYNVQIVPNCKNICALQQDELSPCLCEPYKLCTFSRVMKEKGIEHAVNAVRAINERSGRTVYTLDIYGQPDENQVEWFMSLQKDFPSYVKYGGIIDFDKSIEVLKDYFALLFPTFYDGEGFAGTVIDAFSSGVPVMASDWRYNAEIIEDNKTGVLYKPDDLDALINVLDYYKDNPEKINAMKENCIKAANKYLPHNALKPLFDNLTV